MAQGRNFLNTTCTDKRGLKQPRRLRQIKPHLTMLKNKRLRNGDYFAMVAFCSHSILLKNYATVGLVGMPYN